MSKPLVIALNSKRGKSGKDTLCSLYDGAIRFAFGDALKEECAKTIGVTELAQRCLLEDAHDQKRKDVPQLMLRGDHIPYSDYKAWLLVNDFDMTTPRSVRFHLQQYGNGYVRDFLKQEDRWLNVVKDKVNAMLPCSEVIFITDCRQPNEYEWVKSIGGLVVRVQREDSWVIPEVDEAPLHITDTALDSIDLPVIRNVYGDPMAMRLQLEELLCQLQNK